MIPKLHAKGSSFKGAAQYLLHDKDTLASSERVAWTDTRNLTSDDPHLAWKVMIATAMDQDRLKSRAGVRSSGRKSNQAVLHLTLSWHPEQDPSKDEMIAAGEGALEALGAEDRQTLMVCHNDEDHPHLHLLINRVSPQDGRMLSSSKEKLNLSKWAQAYEEETVIYCDNRVLNNAMRDAGQYVRGEKNVARHIFEAQQDGVANDNSDQGDEIAAQRAKDHALSLRTRNMVKQHQGAWDKLEAGHRRARANIGAQLKKDVAQAEAAILEDMRPEFIALIRRQAAEQHTFDALETSLFGRTSNIARTLRISAEALRSERSGLLKRTFGILGNAGKREEAFHASQAQEREALRRVHRQKMADARAKLKEQAAAKLAENRTAFETARIDLTKRQEVERRANSRAWSARNQERDTAYAQLSNAQASREARSEFTKRADNPNAGPSDYLDLYRQSSLSDAAKGRSDEQDKDNTKDQDISDDD
ncbi:MAG: relaxase/mobilization nuclease domain-containing protein [Pseudomonadota bacterium]